MMVKRSGYQESAEQRSMKRRVLYAGSTALRCQLCDASFRVVLTSYPMLVDPRSRGCRKAVK